MTNPVSVSRGLLIGLVAAAAGSLLAVAFLLGRASGSDSPSVQRSRAEPARPAVAPIAVEPQLPEPPLSPPTPDPVPFEAPARTTPAPAPVPSAPHASPPVPPVVAERGSAAADPTRAEVAAYLDALDRIQPGQMSGDAASVANEMAAALASGDTSGLAKLVRETEAARARVAALRPPAPCAAHHRASLGSLDDALEVLRSLKSAMESPEPAGQLAGVANLGTGLRTRAEELQKEELALRQRYGLTR